MNVLHTPAPHPKFPLRAEWLLGLAIFAALLILAAQANSRSPKAVPPLPSPGAYRIDPVHTFTYFGAWHHVVGLVRGRFESVNGTITVASDLAACALDITIDPASLTTQNAERDADLRGPDFFDAAKFPAVTYRGRGVRRASADSWVMDGTLTIRGISRVVPLTFTFKGLFPDTAKGEPARASFHATAATRRGDFGMTRDNPMELGPNPMGPDVYIELDVEADAVPPAK